MASGSDLVKYDFVRFTMINIHGTGCAKVVPKKQLQRYWKDGIRIPAVVNAFGPRFQEVKVDEGDALGFPNKVFCVVPETLHPLPWVDSPGHTVGEVLLEAYTIDGLPHGACSRTIARQQIDRLQQEFGYKVMSAFEHEFILLHADTLKPVNDPDIATLNFVDYESFFYRLISLLGETGVDIDCFHCEAAEGQFELATTPAYGIQTLDNAFVFKQVVKEVSRKAGYLATFMTKPAEGYANAAHYNLSLWDAQGNNVLHNPQGQQGMSTVFEHWMAGLIRHTPAMIALCSPTVNCYRRMGLPWAPTTANWGQDNRFTAFRVKTYSEDHCYMENRLATGASNPYLVATAMLAAGMDGLRQALPLPPALSKEAPPLPVNLTEALEALEGDDVIKEALGPKFVEWFLLEKRTVELEQLKNHNLSTLYDSELEKERDMYLKYI